MCTGTDNAVFTDELVLRIGVPGFTQHLYLQRNSVVAHLKNTSGKKVFREIIYSVYSGKSAVVIPNHDI